MKSTFNLKLQFANVGLAAALTVAGSAVAQTLPKEGSYDITSCWSGVMNLIAFSKTYSAYSLEMTGTIISNPPGGMFDKMSYRCVLMRTSFDGKYTGHTVCESIDPDGDKRLTNFSSASEGKAIRETVAGTGKYEGMVESGTVTSLGPFPVIKPGALQDCQHQTGTYKLK